MIAGLLRHTAAAGIMFCAASFMAQAAGVLYWWSTGKLNEEKLYQILAVIHGVDLHALEAQYTSNQSPIESEQPSLEELLEQRFAKSLDLSLRETAFDKALAELHALETELRSQRERFDARRREFETRVEQLRQAALEEGLVNVQLKLEAIQPKQAKDLLLKMIGDATKENDDAWDAAVTMLKNMPVEKSRKIMAEFKTADEVDKLHELLRRIRLGKPTTDLLAETENARGQEQNE